MLTAAGRTPAELAGDVLIRVERNRLRLDIARAREAENRFPALRAAIVAENEKLRWAIEQARAANRAAVFPLEQQLAEAQEQSRAASAASAKLHAGCPDKALIAREANLKQRQAGLGARLREIERTIRELAANRKAAARDHAAVAKYERAIEKGRGVRRAASRRVGQRLN